jgi:phage gp45-like
MHRATPVNTSFRSYVAGGARCLVEKSDDKQEMQETKGTFMKAEERIDVESPQNYGFTSLVLEAEKGDDGQIERCAEGFVMFMGGNRTFPVIEVMDDRRYRLRNFKEGEAAVYDDQQQKVHIQRDCIYTRSQYKVEMRVINDQPKMEGHGKDKEADRDQQKDKSRRWSTYVMDKDTITIERTDIDDKDDKDSKKQDEPEKHLKMLSRVFLDSMHVHILTPTISILWDEEKKLLKLNTGRNTILLEDIDKKAIISTTKFTYINMEDGKDEEIKAVTVGAPKKVTLETPANAVVVNDEIKKVQVGDKGASVPAAMLGSIDTNGDKIIGKVAKKVLVI